jgi:HK97 family phage major capsid protein
MNLAATREAALAGIYAARDFLRDNPTPTAANQAQFQALYSGASKHIARLCALQGIPVPAVGTDDPQEAVDRLLAWADMPAPNGGAGPDGALSGMPPFGGAGGTDPSGARSWRIGAGVVSAFEQRGIRYGAELTSSGSVPVSVPIRREPVALARQARFVADLIPEKEAIGGRFSYWKQGTRTNNAGPVVRGAKKPTSVIGGSKVNDEVEVIATLSEPVYRFDLEDAELLRRFLDVELEYLLRVALDHQILSGDNTGAEFNGILEQAATADGGATLLEITRGAVTTLEEAEIVPGAFVFSPATWEAIEVEAQTTFAASPALSPINAIERRLHGIPVVTSNGLPANTGVLGDFAGAAELYRTGPIRIDWSEGVYDPTFDENAGATAFERNMLVFRAEMRAMLAVLDPTAFLALEMVEES